MKVQSDSTRAGSTAKTTSAASKPRKAAAKSGSPSTSGTKKSEAKPSSRLNGQGDWRTERLARMRALILEADPEMVEERKWKKPSNGMTGVPVWSHDGIVCTGETYKSVVKLTFARGASLEDPARLFNSGLEGGVRRAIDIREDDEIDESAFKTLVRAAVAQNTKAER